ncbi:hypothetical protein GDO78_021724, partial [Eleutherodactylus coqui]
MTILMDTLIYLNFVTLIISLPGNIFIIVVNSLDFFKNRRLQLNDQLIFGLSVSSLMQGLLKGLLQSQYLFPFISKETHKIATQIAIYFNLCTLWFSTLLIIHFCLKIVNINHWFYIFLQRTFPKLSTGIIITFLLGCFFINLHAALEINQECLLNTTSKNSYVKESPRCSWSSLIFKTICVLGALLCLVSALIIIISLFKHMNKMKENTQGSRCANMDAHINAMKIVTTLLAANILIFISMFILAFIEKKWLFLFGVLISICHIFSSCLLIKGTKKLNKILVNILNQFSCFQSQN